MKYNKYQPANAHTLELTDLSNLGLSSYPKLIKALESYKNKFNLSSLDEVLQDVSRRMVIDSIKPTDKPVIHAINQLLIEFKEIHGLSLELNNHDSILSGLASDEIDGYFFELDFNELYQPRVLGQKLMDKADIKLKWFNFTTE